MVVVIVNKVGSEICGPLHLPQHIVVLVVLLQVAHETVGVTANVAPRLIDKLVKIIRRMHLFQDMKIMLKAANSLWFVPRFARDLSLIRCKSFPSDAILAENTPVLAHVTATLQISQKCLTNGDVIRSRVVVQLLMPLLIEMALRLRNTVSVHDMEDLVSHLLSVSRTLSNEANHRSENVSGGQETII